MAEAKKDNYQALTAIKHNGKLYKKGEAIALTAEEADPLVRIKAVLDLEATKKAIAEAEAAKK